MDKRNTLNANGFSFNAPPKKISISSALRDVKLPPNERLRSRFEIPVHKIGERKLRWEIKKKINNKQIYK